MRAGLKILSLLLLAPLGGCATIAKGPGLVSRGASSTISATFKPTEMELANPERGFYRSLTTDLAHLNPVEVRTAYSQGHRLMYARIDLGPHRESDALPASLITQLDRAFAEARRSGMKLIVRGTYNYPRGETAYRSAQDAPLPRVLSHIAQLKPVWHRNGDVIAFVQAGFIGAWGEWHTSSNGLTEPAARTAIKDALLDAAPAGRFVQFRYPPYITEWVPSPGAAANALSGSSGIGFHNDCFLASRVDVGTFDDDAAKRDAQRAYVDALGDVAPFGGETCNPADEANASPRTGCADILGEGRRYNLTYLNAGYYRRLFHDRWIAAGCMPEVSRSMGYRISLVSAAHRTVASPGQPMQISLVVRNSGWARIFNARAVAILLRERKSGQVRRLAADGVNPRDWLPDAEHTALLRTALPVDLAPGTYDLLFALPDADRTLADDPRFAIRPANADDPARGQRWEAALGAFSLGTAITLSK